MAAAKGYGDGNFIGIEDECKIRNPKSEIRKKSEIRNRGSSVQCVKFVLGKSLHEPESNDEEEKGDEDD